MAEIPSLGLNDAYLGQVELTPLPLAQWNTVTFTPSPSVLAKLSGMGLPDNVLSVTNIVLHADSGDTGTPLARIQIVQSYPEDQGIVVLPPPTEPGPLVPLEQLGDGTELPLPPDDPHYQPYEPLDLPIPDPALSSPEVNGVLLPVADPDLVPLAPFYVTWQTAEDETAHPYMSFTRGNVLPLALHALYFVGDSDFCLTCFGEDWPEGSVLASAGGRVRGLGGKGNRYYPNADGIVDADQKDYDDHKHIKEKLGCALRACSGLTE